MIQRTTTLAPAITRKRQLTIKELKSLNLPLKYQGDQVIIERSLNDWKLKKPITLELRKVLAARERGLVDYIIRSCLNEVPSLIPFIFDNQSVIKTARHFLRHCSASHKSCLVYSQGIKKYAEWLGYSPDLIIQDIKPQGAIPDPLKTQNHCGFLNDYLADLQDAGLKPSAVSNCIKPVKTSLPSTDKSNSQNLSSRKVAYKDRAPKPERNRNHALESSNPETPIVAAIATGGFRRNLAN